ncbi:hypothetical protein PIB30_038724 [Stylosanthes scabra]|uniref:Uncharacterized protein n=1 Tax=Stylosanthes scabra TaxID=79078 RepID=A0ABU6SET8_9FABA|nr:hypothetical protein [Stylosanthes scabra]
MIGAGKNGPPGKYERWLSSASSGSVGLAMITDRVLRIHGLGILTPYIIRPFRVDELDGAKKLRELMRFWFGVHVDVDDERDESVEGDDVSRGDGGGGYVWGREMEAMKMEAGKVMKMEGDDVSRGDGGGGCVWRREMEAMKMEAGRVMIPNLIIGTRGIELEF